MAWASSLPNFGDFDDACIYERLREAAVDENTLNFAIEFDSTKASAAHNLEPDSIERLLRLEASRCGLIKFVRSKGLFTHIAVHRLEANYRINSATKAFQCEMDVCLEVIINRCGTNLPSSNIWAPERQQKLVKVCSNFSTA